ncbi:hypothetical protein [Paenibacillus pini]|uniref:hypothetical protein n=1 Tax=Paenibacillus pini TaxID=669461 RepID=UPI00068B9FFE|nr:hypothetical protein [Paenibacillus pini]
MTPFFQKGWPTSQHCLFGIAAGLFSGILLGSYLKAVQFLTEQRVYDLLLNVDFVPFLPTDMPEWIEFSFHLIVSLIIGILYVAWTRTNHHPWRNGLWLGMLSSLLFFPLSLLSERVPSVTDGIALLWWLSGHLLYGIMLGICGLFISRTKNPRHSYEN